MKSGKFKSRWPLALAVLAAFVVVALVSYSERYSFGQHLCRNFKDTWFEKSGYIACHRGP